MNRNDARPATIIGLGEILWDIFPDAARFGGAPANFACCTAGLANAETNIHMISAVGRDQLGNRAVGALTDHGVNVSGVQRNSHATGQVHVQLDNHGTASYLFADDAAWDNLLWSDDLAGLAASADAVCWGTLGQRSQPSKDVIQKFVAATPSDCLRVLDVNLRTPYWNDTLLAESLPLANVLKCNEHELPVLASLFKLRGDDTEVLTQLKDRFSLQLVALTRGGQSSTLLHAEQKPSILPAIPTEIVDTVGAGDCFTAALVLGLLNNMPVAKLHAWASKTSAFVCSQAGATPTIPAELRYS